MFIDDAMSMSPLDAVNYLHTSWGDSQINGYVTVKGGRKADLHNFLWIVLVFFLLACLFLF